MKKLVYGIGLNDADYNVSHYNSDGKQQLCPYYSRWKNMLLRVSNGKNYKKFKSYSNVEICKEWLSFSNFKSWMEQQDWQGKEIDKDILSNDVKIYSPETCCFVSSDTNCLFNEGLNGYEKEQGIPIGVKRYGKRFVAQICISNKKITIGYFNDMYEAHRAWQNKKIESIILACLKNDESSIALNGILKILKKLCYEYDNRIETKNF